jgi:hypothetical protein
MNRKFKSSLPGPFPHLSARCVFIRLVGYYRSFIHNYKTIITHLTKLLHKDEFKW